MMTLVAVMGDQWHAVERDLLTLGYRADDIGTERLTLWELISIVVAAPPGSSVHWRMGWWDKTSEMLANYSEQSAGLMHLKGRYLRPGVSPHEQQTRRDPRELGAYGGMPFQAFDKDEFTAKLAAAQANKRKEKGEA